MAIMTSKCSHHNSHQALYMITVVHHDTASLLCSCFLTHHSGLIYAFVAPMIVILLVGRLCDGQCW